MSFIFLLVSNHIKLKLNFRTRLRSSNTIEKASHFASLCYRSAMHHSMLYVMTASTNHFNQLFQITKLNRKMHQNTRQILEISKCNNKMYQKLSRFGIYPNSGRCSLSCHLAFLEPKFPAFSMSKTHGSKDSLLQLKQSKSLTNCDCNVEIKLKMLQVSSINRNSN